MTFQILKIPWLKYFTVTGNLFFTYQSSKIEAKLGFITVLFIPYFIFFFYLIEFVFVFYYYFIFGKLYWCIWKKNHLFILSKLSKSRKKSNKLHKTDHVHVRIYVQFFLKFITTISIL